MSRIEDLVKRLRERAKRKNAEWTAMGGDNVDMSIYDEWQAADTIEQLHASHATLLKLLIEADEMLEGEGMNPPDGTCEAINAAEALERDGGEA